MRTHHLFFGMASGPMGDILFIPLPVALSTSVPPLHPLPVSVSLFSINSSLNLRRKFWKSDKKKLHWDFFASFLSACADHFAHIRQFRMWQQSTHARSRCYGLIHSIIENVFVVVCVCVGSASIACTIRRREKRTDCRSYVQDGHEDGERRLHWIEENKQ